MACFDQPVGRLLVQYIMVTEKNNMPIQHSCAGKITEAKGNITTAHSYHLRSLLAHPKIIHSPSTHTSSTWIKDMLKNHDRSISPYPCHTFYHQYLAKISKPNDVPSACLHIALCSGKPQLCQNLELENRHLWVTFRSDATIMPTECVCITVDKVQKSKHTVHQRTFLR